MDATVFAVDHVTTFTTRRRPPDLIVHAQGRVVTSGWSDARLVPAVYIQPPSDGLWDMSFIATAPQGPALQVISPITASLTIELPAWCKGVRIRASSNHEESSLSEERMHPESWVPYPWSKQNSEVAGKAGETFSWQLPAELVAQADSAINSLKMDSKSDVSQPISSIVGKTCRVFHKGDPITMDLRPDRLNIVLGLVGNQIEDVYFG